MKTESIKIKVADGTEMAAFVAYPDGAGPFPALIVMQEAFGVNHHMRQVCERLAKAGYLSVAPELYHRTAPAGAEFKYTDFASAMPHLQKVTGPTLEADAKAAFAWLVEQSEVKKGLIGTIGFCMGGKAAYVANTVVPLKAAVSFYGGGIAPDFLDKATSQQAPILLGWGGKDDHIKPEQRQAVVHALVKAGKPYVNVVFSEADHGFLCDERPSFHPVASKQAWALTMEFLADHLKN